MSTAEKDLHFDVLTGVQAFVGKQGLQLNIPQEVWMAAVAGAVMLIKRALTPRPADFESACPEPSYAESMFNAYNEQGPNPWKTFDGRPVPKWNEVTDQVRQKWEAASTVARATAMVPAQEDIARLMKERDDALAQIKLLNTRIEELADPALADPTEAW